MYDIVTLIIWLYINQFIDKNILVKKTFSIAWHGQFVKNMYTLSSQSNDNCWTTLLIHRIKSQNKFFKSSNRYHCTPVKKNKFIFSSLCDTYLVKCWIRTIDSLFAYKYILYGLCTSSYDIKRYFIFLSINIARVSN